MSIDEFLDRLAKLAPLKYWYVTTHGYIRCSETKFDCFLGQVAARNKVDQQCPITAFMNQSVLQIDFVSIELGLSSDDTLEIVRAADQYGTYDPVLRQKLLAAVGLN